MKKVSNLINASRVIRMTKSSESKLEFVASKIKNQDLFVDKIKNARKSLNTLDTLPST